MESNSPEVIILLYMFGLMLGLNTSYGQECNFIHEYARNECGYPSIEKKSCLDLGCCWDDGAQSPHLKCYEKSCLPGYFGWGCQFKCNCRSDEVCDPFTGKCPNDCSTLNWGVGCLLDIDCSYNDKTGQQYQGRKARTDSGRICASWVLQHSYPDEQFPDGSKRDAKNTCRNPSPPANNTWCYYSFKPTKKWEWCNLQACDCPRGRYGVNCVHECHCRDPFEVCHPLNGTCHSGCDLRFKEPDCQECNNGWFGLNCQNKCQCADSREECDPVNGHCNSGCAHGYSGPGCQIKCRCRDPNEVCNPVDGSCLSDCEYGWAGIACDIELPQLVRPPILSNQDSTSLSIQWLPWNRRNDRGDGPVYSYIVIYQPASGFSIGWSNVTTASDHVSIGGLDQGVVYSVQVLPVHQDGYIGIPSPVLNASTCGKPLSPPHRVHFRTTGGSHIDEFDNMHESSLLDMVVGEIPVPDLKIRLELHWTAPTQQEWNCGRLLKYRIYKQSITKEFSVWKESDIHRAMIGDVSLFQNFTAGVTAVNSANFESDINAATFIGRSSPVRNLKVASPTPSTLHVTWTTPQYPNARIDRFVLRYKEIRVADCDVEHSHWSETFLLLGQQREYMLRDLKPYSRYQIRLWPETESGKGVVAMTHGITQPKAPVRKVADVKILAVSSDTARFSWEPIGCEDRFGTTAGYLYEVVERPMNIIRSTQLLNSTEVTIHGLIPYKSYTFIVKYVNHHGSGPFTSQIVFKTKEGRPPPPENVEIISSTSTSLLVGWSPPNPPHGIITGYEIMYWSSVNIGRPDKVLVQPEVNRHNLADLKTTSGYGIQMRSYTIIGSSVDWSPVVYGYTEEARPDSPRFFRNVSRTSDSIYVTWKEPKIQNGFLRTYKLLCAPMTMVGPNIETLDIEVELPASARNFTLVNLSPGTPYVCSLRASTSKGYGQPLRRTFWTLPRAPEPLPDPIVQQDKKSQTTIVVQLSTYKRSKTQKQFDPESTYQVIVEKMSGRSRRSTVETPCGIPYSELLDFTGAAKQALQCYIAAEFKSLSSERFIVGDNQTYGNYYNAPLEPGQDYTIWFGKTKYADGETAATFSRSLPYSTAELVYPEEPEDTNVAMVAGIGVAALFAVILIIIIVALLISRRRHSNKETKELILPDKLPTPNGSAVDKPTRPPRKHELIEPNLQYKNAADLNSDLPLIALDKYVIADDKEMTKMIPLPDESSSCSGRSSTSESEEDNEAVLNLPNPLYSSLNQDEFKYPVLADNLWNVINEKKASKTAGFRQEYELLAHGMKAKHDIARKMQNKSKNRYGNIEAYDHSRVILERFPDDPHSDYINANYIDGYRKTKAFIATQGPTKQTVNDIWRMAWQENSHRIIMLTKLIEDGKRKCEMYWPERIAQRYGQITVQLIEVEEIADYTIRSFILTKDNESKHLRQFHFMAWPDHGVPLFATSLLSFRKKVHSYDDPTAGPTIVHCSAGVGRTGSYIGIDSLLDQAFTEGLVDVFSWVQLMRAQRVNMVQTLDQYAFVYDALLEALKCGDTSIACPDCQNYYESLCQGKLESGISKLEEQFQMLGVMSSSINIHGCSDALDPDNIKKNRFKDIIPLDNSSRPYLVTYIPGATDYINAVFCDGYRQKDAFIITQMPLPTTVMDFWTMIYDHESKTIVMMNQMDKSDLSCAKYWPNEVGASMHCGPFTVDLISIESDAHPDVIIRDFVVTYNKRGTDPHHVRQFQYRGWPSNEPVPPYCDSLLRLIGLVEKWQQRSGNSIITVHCMNGAERSGLFCSTNYLLDRLKLEQDVDVFQSVKHCRITRPQLLPNVSQYHFLYELAIDYMDSFDTYANFK